MIRLIFFKTTLLAFIFLGALGAGAQEIFQIKPYYPTVTLSGLTHPRKEMTVTSEVSGRCVEIYADVSDLIPDSGRLAEIDATYLKLDIEANKIAQQQSLRRLKQEKKTLDRYTVLIEKESTAQAEFDEIALEVDLTALSLKKLQNEEERLQEMMVRHTIMAPPGWQVIERFAEPGEFIQAGQKIAHLGDFQNLLVRFAVTYSELQTLEDLSRLDLWLPDLGEQIGGVIYQTSPVVDVETRKIPLEVMIHTEEMGNEVSLRGGMRAELTFQSGLYTRSYVIPRSALISSYDAHWLIAPDGSKQQIILLDQLDDGSMAIISGDTLKSGMQFLLNPSERVE